MKMKMKIKKEINNFREDCFKYLPFLCLPLNHEVLVYSQSDVNSTLLQDVGILLHKSGTLHYKQQIPQHTMSAAPTIPSTHSSKITKLNSLFGHSFLEVQNSSIGDLVTHWLTHGTLLIDIQRATQETCDLWDIWLERWGAMKWPKKRQWQRQIQRQRQWQRQIHLESTFKERS